MLQIKIKRLSDEAKIPAYTKPGDAGVDICAIEEKEILPGKRELIKTGIAMEIPVGYEAQVRPRSGLALKHGLSVLNSPGTIDSGYRGELGVILMNHAQEPFHIEKGMRIAQVVFARCEYASFAEVDELSETERGTGGFGHTGIKTINEEGE